ncbi:MAG: NUDIX domain-containing protein [Caldilinea sp. CFX5]|nr:NUDIX domain-containing protein [Caldilinea sp. CFX5]
MRLAVDAVVEHAGQLLLIEYDDVRLGRHWGLPGGGVEAGERIHDALRREVLEETGAQVVVGRLLLVNEFDPAGDGGRYTDDHELRLVFHCTLVDNRDLIAPSIPDPDQIGVSWVALADLRQVSFFPQIADRLYYSLTSGAGGDLFNTKL